MIENTSSRDPLIHLLGGIGSDSYIEDMEAKGQQEIVGSEKLPADLKGDFESLGFVLGEVDPDDPLFMDVTLPGGWKRQPTDHPMWSEIVDERGIARVAVFYKAAFYDRRAFARVESPGRNMATRFLYGDGPIDPKSGLLTAEEQGGFDEALDEMEGLIEEHPDIYGEYQQRLRSARQTRETGCASVQPPDVEAHGSGRLARQTRENR